MVLSSLIPINIFTSPRLVHSIDTFVGEVRQLENYIIPFKGKTYSNCNVEIIDDGKIYAVKVMGI